LYTVPAAGQSSQATVQSDDRVHQRLRGKDRKLQYAALTVSAAARYLSMNRKHALVALGVADRVQVEGEARR
jgi:sensor domain CHASE-containing protein